VAEGVVEIEADFGALEEAEKLDVAGGDAVFEEHAGVIGAQGQTPFRGDAEEVDLDAAAGVGVIDGVALGMAEAVEFAVAHRGSVHDEVEDGARLSAGNAAYGDRRRFELTREGDLGAPDQGLSVTEEIAAGETEARARNIGADLPGERDRHGGVAIGGVRPF